MANHRLGAAAALTLAFVATVACSSPASTEPPGPAPIQATPPITEPIAATLDLRVGAPSAAEAPRRPIAVTPPYVPSVNLIWRLSPPDNGPFKAGEELSLMLDLDPLNLAVSGIQFNVNYPEEFLQFQEIVPGGILGPEPLMVDKLDRSDSSQGQVLFALARRGDTVAPTGPGHVASIKLLTRQEIHQNENVIIWLDRVKVTGEKFQTIGQESVSWSLTGPD